MGKESLFVFGGIESLCHYIVCASNYEIMRDQGLLKCNLLNRVSSYVFLLTTKQS